MTMNATCVLLPSAVSETRACAVGLSDLPLSVSRAGVGRGVPIAIRITAIDRIEATLAGAFFLLGIGLWATGATVSFLLTLATGDLGPVDLLARQGTFLPN
jgi:hypothetical protein